MQMRAVSLLPLLLTLGCGGMGFPQKSGPVDAPPTGGSDLLGPGSGNGSDGTDSDGDGIPDSTEGDGDADGDGNPNSNDTDSDGDGIPDATEGSGDDDGDGTPDFLDPDADGDGIPDAVEGMGDSDGDGIPDYLDPDSDGDGIPDTDEGWDDIDGDGIPAYLDPDSDGDGIPDSIDDDLDGDGLSDADEGDGDSDGDGTPDFSDIDSDNDGIPDSEEIDTDPTNPDTDGDGWTDLQEDTCGSDPTDPSSSCDGFNGTVNAYEINEVVVTYDTQIQMGDIMFILDETCSMTGTLDDVAIHFSDVADDISSFIPDLTFGVASFDDYNYGSMGSGADKPFHPRQQQTTNLAAAQAALDSLTADGGDDWTESTIEALYQAATGFGYDQGCDGNYDPSTDVLPFSNQPVDAFGGWTGGWGSSSSPGTGSLGGNGFRQGAVPILVYATDATVRNAFPPFGQGPRGNLAPSGCALDATAPMLEAAMQDIHAKAIGVAASTTDASAAMGAVAQFTDSWMDSNGNGLPDPNEWMVYSSVDYNIVDLVTNSIAEFTANVTYDLTLEAEDPTDTLVLIDPPVYYNVPALNTVTFTLTLEPSPGVLASMFSDTVYIVPTTLYGDGGVVLASWDLIFLVEVDPASVPIP